jgi:hypothetical protein
LPSKIQINTRIIQYVGGIVLERIEKKSSDDITYVFAGLAILAMLAFFALRSVIVLHRITLPALYFQANVYSRLFSCPDYKVELYRIRNIRNLLDAELAKKGNYAAIRKDMLIGAVESSSEYTTACTRIITAIVLGSCGLLITGSAMRTRHRLYGTRKDVRHPGQKGIEGFVRLLEDHLGPGMVTLIQKYPGPDNLGHAFSMAREKANIPCSLAARLFPKGSKERLAILEYGKAKVTFALQEGTGEAPGRGRTL